MTRVDFCENIDLHLVFGGGLCYDYAMSEWGKTLHSGNPCHDRVLYFI